MGQVCEGLTRCAALLLIGLCACRQAAFRCNSFGLVLCELLVWVSGRLCKCRGLFHAHVALSMSWHVHPTAMQGLSKGVSQACWPHLQLCRPHPPICVVLHAVRASHCVSATAALLLPQRCVVCGVTCKS